jgi:hypothetical protein
VIKKRIFLLTIVFLLILTNTVFAYDYEVQKLHRHTAWHADWGLKPHVFYTEYVADVYYGESLKWLPYHRVSAWRPSPYVFPDEVGNGMAIFMEVNAEVDGEEIDSLSPEYFDQYTAIISPDTIWYYGLESDMNMGWLDKSDSATATHVTLFLLEDWIPGSGTYYVSFEY